MHQLTATCHYVSHAEMNSPLSAMPADTVHYRLTTTGSCGRCQRKRPSCDDVHALLLYQEPVNFLVQQFKFNRKLEYGRLFSAIMAEKMASLDQRPDLLIPVPLHSSRLRSRGYNQAWELARHLSKITGIPSSHKICQRIKKTPLQTGLKASERRRNLKQAFAIKQDINGLHICIVDDVMTTGSTLEAIASVLKSAGAGSCNGNGCCEGGFIIFLFCHTAGDFSLPG